MLDQHHCHCFSLHPNYHNTFRDLLENIEFREPLLQLDRGQKYGLAKQLTGNTQIHVKLLKNGVVEGEIEYPSHYPFAHTNPEHSYSAHDEIEQILNHLEIPYTRKTVPPITCIRRVIKKAFKPTHVNTIIAMVGLISAIGVSAYLINRELKKS